MSVIELRRFGSSWEASFGEDRVLAGAPLSAVEELLRRVGSHFGYISPRTVELGYDEGRVVECDVLGCHLHTGAPGGQARI